MYEVIQQVDGESIAKRCGWSGKNVFLGLVLLLVGFIIWFTDSVVMGMASGVSGKKFVLGFWGDLGFLLMAFGVLGYWVSIPAIQKWWHSKKWLALVFIIPSVLIGLMILVAIFKS
ncbi:MAG: hypothetical protein KGI50_04095 [Patescibacteria group bacterium]|nr:hypothetical protein [Patescibacteria group bacterium]MDE2438870.1 hypothetical protein [Patescibacteria group bacterium]